MTDLAARPASYPLVLVDETSAGRRSRRVYPSEPATVPAGTLRPEPRQSHLSSLDTVRVLTVVGVVSVHAVSLTITSSTLAGGAFLSVAHVTRSIFIGLSGFVLAYRAGDGGIRPVSFWRRRYLFVVVPYVAWSAIYEVADGAWGSPLHLLGRFVTDLGTGGARYHLYFLLLTFQLYAVFPWVLAAVRRVDPWRLVAGSVAVQLLFTAGTHWWSGAPGVVGVVLSHPGSWLWSYQLYVVLGVTAALHFEAVSAWILGHSRAVALSLATALALGLGSFFVQVEAFSMTAAKASEVFQPTVTVVALAAIVALFALGLHTERRLDAGAQRTLTAGSDTSFGVYLAHPLLLQGLVALGGAIGVPALLASVPSALQLLLVLVVVVPVTYFLTAVAMAVVRRTPLSLALSGRRMSTLVLSPSHSNSSRSLPWTRSSSTSPIAVPSPAPMG